MKDLFGYEAAESAECSRLPRAPLFQLQNPPPRGKHYVEPRGYAAAPGSGPDGLKCKDCAFYVSKRSSAGSYPKCAKVKARWTGGRATDILAGAPACKEFDYPMEGGVMDGSNRTTGGWIGQP